MPVPTTNIRTSHAISILVNTKVVGQIQSWAPTQSKTITATFELNSDTSGEPTENIPGNLSGLTIQVSRYDLFASKMEEVWGKSNNLWMLSKQLHPFVVQEKWKNPDNTTEYMNYEGCWFSQLGRNMSAQGDRIVLVNATLNYVRIWKS